MVKKTTKKSTTNCYCTCECPWQTASLWVTFVFFVLFMLSLFYIYRLRKEIKKLKP